MSARHLRPRALLHDHLLARLRPATSASVPDLALAEALGQLIGGWNVREVPGHPLAPDDPARLTVEASFRLTVTLTEGEVRARREAAEQRLAVLRWAAASDGSPPPAGVGVLDLLDQDVWWVPKEGGARRLTDLGPRHRSHLLTWLQRRAALLKDRYEFRFLDTISGPLGPRGEAACDSVDRAMGELLEQSPADWLAERPLYARLRRLVQADRDAGVSRGPGRAEGGGDGV